MRLLLEQHCFVLLTSNATDTAANHPFGFLRLSHHMSCYAKVPLDALKKTPESGDLDHSD